jgi:dTMP kinase
MTPRGLFVALEGIDGSGKSTQARRLAEAHAALCTREPGGTPLGAQLRTWLLDASHPMDAATEALLMLADRAHHVATVIEPALAAGRSVVSDRFFGSTIAYQGYGRGLDLATLVAATELAVHGRWPDRTVLLDLPVAVARERSGGADRFESAGLDFLTDVRRGYLALAEQHGWSVVDATQTESDVARAVDAATADLVWPS